jgi:hypothetical protein
MQRLHKGLSSLSFVVAPVSLLSPLLLSPCSVSSYQPLRLVQPHKHNTFLGRSGIASAVKAGMMAKQASRDSLGPNEDKYESPRR